jgi:plastocyanin
LPAEPPGVRGGDLLSAAVRGRRLAACALVASAAPLFLAVPAAGAAATITVEPSPGEDAYSPKRVAESLDSGTFTWIWGPQGAGSADAHDVQQDAGLFDSGAAKSDGSFTVTAAAGTFPYFCSLHYEMRGRVAVAPAADPGYPEPFRVRWATSASETGRRFDVRYKAGNGRWKIWLDDSKRRSAVFGRAGKPVAVGDGIAYRFEARAIRTRLKRSDWSPALFVGP